MFTLISTDGTVTPLPDTTGRDVVAALVTGRLGQMTEKIHSGGTRRGFRAICDDTALWSAKAKNDVVSEIIGQGIHGAAVLTGGTASRPDRDLPLTDRQLDVIAELAHNGVDWR